MMAELLGKATGTNKGKGGTMHIADINKGMLGAQRHRRLQHSRRNRRGAQGPRSRVPTSSASSSSATGPPTQGVLHESMNLAGIWKLPILFVCENNRYAQSTPVEYAVAGESVADRAAGYNMPGIAVDGMSVLDMYEVAGEAVRRARAGEGPTLIEALTYRYMGHFGADNPLLYRTEAEEVEFRSRDCNEQLKTYLLENGVATEGELEAMNQKAVDDVEEAARFANESPFPDPSELMTDVYVSYN